jgi:hypothetical protein
MCAYLLIQKQIFAAASFSKTAMLTGDNKLRITTNELGKSFWKVQGVEFEGCFSKYSAKLD